jgi:glucose-6-phosphate 1-epimerase
VTSSAVCTPAQVEGLPGHRVVLPCGDSVAITEHGAHVVSWRSQGRERFYMSPASLRDGQAALRGGVPVCWPQFNQRGPLPKHGFARNLPWHLQAFEPQGEGAVLTMALLSGERTLAHWAAGFEARGVVNLQPGRFQFTLSVRNTGAVAWSFTGALHSYLAVDGVSSAHLDGLGGQPEWDAVRDVRGVAEDRLVFSGEFDRVYTASPHALTLRDGAHGLRILQSPSWADTVVWNPGAARAAALPDLPPGGWRRYLCVEAAQVFEPVVVAPGETWMGWQALEVLGAA